MTVALVFNNSHDGVCITDSRLTMDADETDLGSKLFLLHLKEGDGFLTGAGEISLLYLLVEHARKSPGLTVDGMATHLMDYLKEINPLNVIDRSEHGHVNVESLYGPASFLLLGLHEGKVRKWDLRSYHELKQLAGPMAFFGNGESSVGKYVFEKLPGRKIDALAAPELLYHALCAYARSTLTVGVGGKPNIGFIADGRARLLDHAREIALAHVTYAHMSGYGSLADPAVAKGFVDELAAKDHPDLERIASALNLNVPALTELEASYNSWMYRANTKPLPRE